MALELDVVVDGESNETLCAGAAVVVAAIKPTWTKDNLNFKIYTDGITNKLVGVWHKDEPRDNQLLVRVYGKKTEYFIDRTAEKRNIEFLHPRGCGPVLHCSFSNGLCYSYTVGVPLTPDHTADQRIYTAILTHMAKLHSVQMEGNKNRSMLFTKLRQFLNLLPNLDTKDCFKRVLKKGYNKEFLSKESSALEEVVETLQCPLSLTHNDLLLANIIWNEELGHVRFIDFEYASLNYQPFDVANHFCEFAGLDVVDYSRYPSQDYQRNWLKKYLEKLETPSRRSLDWWVGAVQVLALASHLFWGSWALLQAQHSTIDFDFAGYSLTRLEEYSRCKEKFLKEGVASCKAALAKESS